MIPPRIPEVPESPSMPVTLYFDQQLWQRFVDVCCRENTMATHILYLVSMACIAEWLRTATPEEAAYE